MLQHFVSTGIIHYTVLINAEAQKGTEAKIVTRPGNLHLKKERHFSPHSQGFFGCQYFFIAFR